MYLGLARQTVRNVNLSSALVYQECSQKVKHVFPDLPALVRLGLLTDDERVQLANTPHDTHAFFLPFCWAHSLANHAQDAGMFRNGFHVRLVLDSVEQQRVCQGNLLGYSWVTIPLLFTQVAIAAVYIHFALAVIGEQFLDPAIGYPGHGADWFIPFFSMMRSITLLVGWLKAAELMKSPFGEDDDSFEIDWILCRNIDEGADIVSRMAQDMPTLSRDPHWERCTPTMDALHGRDARRRGHGSSYGREPFEQGGSSVKEEGGEQPLL